MEYKDYYKILGVDRSADDKAIKTAYRRLARKHHPDVSKGSAARFQELNEAYEVLGDPDKRQRYDALGSDWQRVAAPGARSPSGGGEVHVRRGEAPGGFSEFFQAIFGDLGGGRGRVRDSRRGGLGDIGFGDLGDLGAAGAADVEAALELSLEEAFRGVRRAISLDLDEPCAACGGAGHVNRRPCGQCRGSGWAKGRRQLEVKIPAGVDTGSRIRVPGEGAGPAGGRRGDLYLRVTVRPDERFERRGDDLYLDLAIPFVDAALGAEVQVATLKGPVSMKVPPETSGGRTFRLPGYGMPRLKGGGAGDQYVRVQLTVPAGLTPREKELLTDLKRLRPEMPR
ncbi:MAG: DnaJ domain-containing protein [Candidatus Rokubacteria bacterium]|nr:DnaJ domain-containing protein [Candidatus Rokubacteria bacterium]MBI3105999.1 DnaJ domain-containing protein [Candidatus Rokubacteria bacterium]